MPAGAPALGVPRSGHLLGAIADFVDAGHLPGRVVKALGGTFGKGHQVVIAPMASMGKGNHVLGSIR
ncbi:hypothetical protein D3C80_1936650 [compost metagenome]